MEEGQKRLIPKMCGDYFKAGSPPPPQARPLMVDENRKEDEFTEVMWLENLKEGILIEIID